MGEFPLAALIGALGVVAAVLGFVFGRKSGRQAEIVAQQRAKATAEETATRILEEAGREAENIRKGAVVSGREELLQLREAQELEVRQRRLDVEREEKRVVEREAQLDRARESLEGREHDLQQRGKERRSARAGARASDRR
jgi:ribonuclease Y